MSIELAININNNRQHAKINEVLMAAAKLKQLMLRIPPEDFAFLSKKAKEAGLKNTPFCWFLVKKALNEMKKAA